MNSYYRTGKLENCAYGLSNIYVCLRAKAQRDEAKAHIILRREIKSTLVAPEPIWKLKDTPSWNVSSSSESNDKKTGS